MTESKITPIGEKILGVTEAAEIAKKDVSTVRRWCKERKFPASKNDQNDWIIGRSDLIAYLEADARGEDTNALASKISSIHRASQQFPATNNSVQTKTANQQGIDTESAIDELKRNHEAELQKLKQKSGDQIEELKQGHEAELHKLEEDHEAKLKQNEEFEELKIEKIKREADDQVKKIQKRSESTVKQKEDEIKKVRSDMQDRIDAQKSITEKQKKDADASLAITREALVTAVGYADKLSNINPFRFIKRRGVIKEYEEAKRTRLLTDQSSQNSKSDTREKELTT